MMAFRSLAPRLAAASTAAARLPRTAPRRLIGAGYTGPREKGYDAAAMDAFRSLEDQPFFMLNLLKIDDFASWAKYSALCAELKEFQESGAETVYAGQVGDKFDMPVLVAGDEIDTSGYSLLLLVKYASKDGFFRFIDSPGYHAAYAHRLKALEDGKSTLIPSFPFAGSATQGLKVKIPGQK